MANWNCKTIDVYTHEHNGHEQVIYNVHWRVSKEDEEYSASSYGTQSLNTENIKDFKPFDEVTSVMVEGWVKDAMGEVTVTALEESLNQQIEDQKNPTSETITLDN
nr:hypothetical protein [uncultured Mediterranean phage uvMED]BAR29199.1 hypothetical protein [uncultured Mediterranean phage uvMED]|tara:strand:- start:722 stop:1039 length:318 start_codon:yes stop_codon:yes gene_type:complete